MDVVPVSLDGASRRQLYEVRFNGSVLTSCYHDTDCPGKVQLCAINVTWAAHPTMCTCDGVLGYVGYDEPGPLYHFVVATTAITLIVTMVTLLVNQYTLISALMIREERKLNKFMISQSMANITTIMWLATTSVLLRGILTFPDKHRLETGVDALNPDRIVRQQEVGITHVLMQFLSFILFTLNMFYLTGVWTTTAIAFKKLSVQKGVWVERLCIAYTAFAIVVFVPLSTEPSIWNTGRIVIAVITLLLGVSFLVAGWKMRFVVLAQSSEVNSKLSNGEGEDASVIRMRQILTKIYRTAVKMGVLCLAAVISIAVYSLGVPWKLTYIPPSIQFATREFGFRIGLVLFSILNAVIGEYLFTAFRQKYGTSSNKSPASVKDGGGRPERGGSKSFMSGNHQVMSSSVQNEPVNDSDVTTSPSNSYVGSKAMIVSQQSKEDLMDK